MEKQIGVRMKKKLSVIMPVYNAEKYLDKSIQSIINQTYKNIELIMIDDYSNDNSIKIMEKYLSDNIILIKNLKNSGAGYSRNEGLKICTGEYIGYIDADDYIEPDYYEKMINQMEKENSDIVVCDIFVKYENNNGINQRTVACEGKIEKYNFLNNGLSASPCNKIFKRKDILKYPFPEGIMNEDVSTIIPIMIKSTKISYNEDVYYNYIQRKTSVQNSSLNESRMEIFKALDILEQRIPINSKTKKYWDAIIFNQLLMFYIYVIPQEKNFLKRKKYLKKFNILSKKYNLCQNENWNLFLNSKGKKHRIYYQLLLKLNCMRLYLLSDILIEIYHLYNNKIKKSVIKKYITIDDIEKQAKRQQKLKKVKYKISVVIPNYNYEKFLLQRLYSILYQTTKIDEIIILDDVSTDNSRILIDKIYDKTKKYINIKKVYNDKNSGSAFKQWEKGFMTATGDYIWIAEADDYSKKTFLKTVTKPLKKYDDIKISYVDTAFIDKDGYVIMRSIKPEIDILKTGHWDKNFINEGINEINDYAYLNCTIANVSSVLFKNDNYSSFFKESGKFKQAGDWLFYVNVMNQGKIAYSNKPINYYRVHGNNVTSVTKKQAHFNEIIKIHDKISKIIKLNNKQKKNINERYKFLKKVWNIK